MSLRKKKRRFLKKSNKVVAPPEEVLSDRWYSNREVWKKLDISESTCKRWRKEGLLPTFMRHRRLYFNDYHVQKILRSGRRD
jgi:transposase